MFLNDKCYDGLEIYGPTVTIAHNDFNPMSLPLTPYFWSCTAKPGFTEPQKKIPVLQALMRVEKRVVFRDLVSSPIIAYLLRTFCFILITVGVTDPDRAGWCQVQGDIFLHRDNLILG